MHLVAVGVNQHTAPVELRERLACDGERLPAALAGLRRVAAEGFVLSTCNRVEAYALVGHATSGAEGLAHLLAERAGLPAAALLPCLYLHTHAAAARHLFNVSAGLDSMVVGEDQILAQVKGALDAARMAGTLGPALSRLGNMALATGKAVRAGTGINRHHLSVVSVALRLAALELGGLSRATVLILGAGRVAELAIKHLAGAAAGRRPASVTVVNRTLAHAATLAGRYGARARPWAELAAALGEADLVIGCTGAPAPVVTVEGAGPAATRAQLYLDLAVPRDIEPAVGGLPGVTLYDMDRLQAICAANQGQRLAEVARAGRIVAAAVERYMAWWQARSVAPTIAALHAQAAGIRDAEVARTLARLPDLTAGEQAAVAYLAEALVNKLLHRPVTALKEAAEGANMARVVQQLFGLTVPPASATPALAAWPDRREPGDCVVPDRSAALPVAAAHLTTGAS